MLVALHPTPPSSFYVVCSSLRYWQGLHDTSSFGRLPEMTARGSPTAVRLCTQMPRPRLVLNQNTIL